MNDAEIRADILDTAKGYVLKDRNATYGSPEDNFRRIAILWEAYDQIRQPGPETPIDVSIKMILMKVARLAHNPTHKDSWVDIAGYSACGAGIALAEPKAFDDSLLDKIEDPIKTAIADGSGSVVLTYRVNQNPHPDAAFCKKVNQDYLKSDEACQASQTPSPSSGSPS